jgi:transcriptional regulator with PAS, ATPase and Fis domain
MLHGWAELGVPVRLPSTRELMGVLIASEEELTPLLTVERLGRMAARLEQLLAHEELVRRVALLDAHQRFLLDHPQDAVLALDGRGQVWGVSPATAQFLPTPHHLLAHSLLRGPGLQVEGLRACTQPSDGRPYEIAVNAQERGLTLRATALPVYSEQHVVGSLVVLRPPTASRPQRGTSTPPWRARYTFADLLGAAPAFQHSVSLARRAAPAPFPVLLLGESGTGKELLAQAIHTASPRGQGPFVAVNCGAGSDELLSAELFGYAAGAFTGAVKGGRKGKVELAHGGTLFLDEVEAMSAKMQVSLLRVLEEGRVTPVGAESPVAVDVRVIAAANEDVQEAVGQKRFRLDLYHRLAVFPIMLPPLRERTEDLPVLIRHLLDDLGFSQMQPTAEVLTLLGRYAWPGNVRELRNVLLRAAYLAPGTAITPAELPQEISSAVALPAPPPHGSLRDTEREMIDRALADTQGNLTTAAARLGIHRATLYRKVKQFGLLRVG